MVECKNCGACFRDSYDLNKHMSKLKPCLEKKVEENSGTAQKRSSTAPKQSSTAPKQSSTAPKQSSEAPKQSSLNCMFCLNHFSTNYNLKRHNLTCKLKEDPVRLLEIENEIEPVLPECKLECRFCNLFYQNISNLNKHIKVCKERENYHKFLLTKQKTTVNNNIVINNNNIINNNIVINLVGQESIEHIDPERIINLLRDIDQNYEPSQVFLKAGKLITSFDELICEKEENKNLIIPYSKCLYSEVKTPTGWKKSEVDDSLNRSFKNSAKKLYDTKESIENHNDKVFKYEKNNHIFKEVKGFANKGFNYNSLTSHPDDLRKIRSGYKISKLKEEEF